MTPEQKISRKKRLVSSARATLSGQIGLSVGVFRICRNISSLDEDLNNKYPIFQKFQAEMPPSIPVGSARLLWEYDALMKTDVLLNNLEQKHRSCILEACISIIKSE